MLAVTADEQILVGDHSLAYAQIDKASKLKMLGKESQGKDKHGIKKIKSHTSKHVECESIVKAAFTWWNTCIFHTGSFIVRLKPLIHNLQK